MKALLNAMWNSEEVERIGVFFMLGAGVVFCTVAALIPSR